MDKKIIKINDTEIEEYKFHQNKRPILINDIDVTEIVASNNLYFGKQDFKHFIGYKGSEKIRLLSIICLMIYIKEILMKIDVFIF